jgi:hypothetical protein
MIKLLVIGNLGKDAIVNNVNGKNVINFSVAHTEKYKDAQGNPKDRTVWVECAYWTDKTAIAPYLKKERKFMLKEIQMLGLIQHKMEKRGFIIVTNFNDTIIGF